MLPKVGQLVDGKYTIERELGQGGMAVVFAAHHKVLDRPVALKFLSPELPRTAELVQRFLTEARAAARVESPHIARVYDVGTLDDGLPFIVMERLEGCDLEELLVAYKRLPVGDAVDYVLQSLQGLASAHVLGVIHRDLKPSNLYLSTQADGTSIIKVLDFGLAKLVDEARLMARGTTAGSPTYMSPEQMRDVELVDPRADIWSIGVVLYELLTGQTPFKADGIGETFAAVLQQAPTPAREHRADVPVELEAAVMRCLHRNPDERFDDVAELAFAITPFGTGAYAALADAIEQTLRQQLQRVSGSAVIFPAERTTSRNLATVRIAFADERAVALYGDSTPSTLDTGFFGFLGDALDVVAEVLVRDEEIAAGRDARAELPKETDAEIQRLRALASAAKATLAAAQTGGPSSPSARVASSAVGHVEAAVATEIATLEATLARELSEIPKREKSAREACASVFDGLLLRHDLPGAASWLELRASDGDRYAVSLRGNVDYGIAWRVALEIPPKHALGRVARLEKLARIEVNAPELTGWIRKEIKLRPQRLDRYYLTELLIGASSLTMRLRSEADGTGTGFDVQIDTAAAKFELSRPGTDDAPYAVSKEDAVKLTELHATLSAVARELATMRKRVLEATIDGQALWQEHDPRIVAERIVGVLVPLVREVGMRSPNATELALKSVGADNQRTEIFVSKAELRKKLDRVPERARVVIGPMLLALDSGGVRTSQPSYPRLG